MELTASIGWLRQHNYSRSRKLNGMKKWWRRQLKTQQVGPKKILRTSSLVIRDPYVVRGALLGSLGPLRGSGSDETWLWVRSGCGSVETCDYQVLAPLLVWKKKAYKMEVRSGGSIPAKRLRRLPSLVSSRSTLQSLHADLLFQTVPAWKSPPYELPRNHLERNHKPAASGT